MNLFESINYYKLMSKNYDIAAKDKEISNITREGCLKVSAEYAQVVDWLSELKERREADVQNEVLQYLFNKEREAESMPYSDVRQERIATLREVIRYVEGIGDTNG